ncbi:MAG: DnaJ family molecular chaperone [Rubrimonas sp.]|uniref:DnaJ family molecular chaperone n=1 Tax=Rubrimonas sp. TaxID=2036015 RepID=UPI002FDD8806
MSIWRRIADAAQALARGEKLSAVLERLSTPPQRRVAFTIAVIALGAKMAKADGRVTRDEVAAFREVFTIPRASERSAAMLFDSARRDVAGFETYAAQIARMFGPGSATLSDLLDGLFHIALADGAYHEAEDAFLGRCAEIFGVPRAEFERLRAAYAPERDPWAVLGLPPGADPATARARWRALVRETHPDRMIARGLPEEAIKLATARLARINAAYEQIMAE